MAAFRRRAASLIGGDLDDICLIQIESNHLIARTLAHLDFNGVDEGSAAPVIVARRQRKLLAWIPAGDGKSAACGEFCRCALCDSIGGGGGVRRGRRVRTLTHRGPATSRRGKLPRC